jgi:general secretion pathway protein A
MYLEYYGLEQAPFSITPDPHYVFLSEQHRDALAHLLYGIRQGGGGGFVQLTGEVGTGKTTLSRLLLEQLPENTQAALVLNPRLDPIELMQTICEELRLPVAGTPAAPSGKRRGRAAARPTPGAKALYDALRTHLLEAYARGERVVLIIDEAQNLSAEALEQVRLLTNLETETQKLLQIILIGQPELRELLARPDLRQLAQRITARYHLRPLDEAGTTAYLRHRLNIAGAQRFPFSTDAVRRVHKRSGGVPRLINVIAERALLGGYAHDLLSIDARTVDRAADEALAPSHVADSGGMRLRSRPIRRMIAGAIGIAAVALAFFLVRRDADPAPQTATAPQLRAIAPTQVSNGAIDGAALLQRLRATPVDDRRAWDGLAASWDAPAAVRAASPDACPPQPAPGWRCLRSRAQIEQLLRYDRPVLLRLRAEPHTAWARLLGADAARVRLALGDATLEVDRIGLAGLWNGEFLALWRAPDTLEARHAAGDAVAAEWLRARLRGEGVDATDLSAALRTFQARNGLRNDGALDPQTVFALTRTDPGPRLRSQEP